MTALNRAAGLDRVLVPHRGGRGYLCDRLYRLIADQGDSLVIRTHWARSSAAAAACRSGVAMQQ